MRFQKVLNFAQPIEHFRSHNLADPTKRCRRFSFARATFLNSKTNFTFSHFFSKTPKKLSCKLLSSFRQNESAPIVLRLTSIYQAVSPASKPVVILSPAIVRPLSRSLANGNVLSCRRCEDACLRIAAAQHCSLLPRYAQKPGGGRSPRIVEHGGSRAKGSIDTHNTVLQLCCQSADCPRK